MSSKRSPGSSATARSRRHLPEVTVRYAEPLPITRLERQTLALLCGGMSYAEIHRYLWFDDDWLKVLDFDPGPTLTLKNPATVGTERLRTTLIPGLLAAVELNRRHFEQFELLEIGSAFPNGQKDTPEQTEQRHLALAIVAPGRKPRTKTPCMLRLKTDLETFARQTLRGHLQFAPLKAAAPVGARGQDRRGSARRPGHRTDHRCARRVPAPIDEHLAAWSIALAEINLSLLAEAGRRHANSLPYRFIPRINLDFSVVADSRRRYEEIERALAAYDHPLLRRLAFVDSYEGGSIPQGKRSFTFRGTIGDPSRTLTEQDIQDFRAEFHRVPEASGPGPADVDDEQALPTICTLECSRASCCRGLLDCGSAARPPAQTSLARRSTSDTVWSGIVEIRNEVCIRDAKVQVEPGSTIRFMGAGRLGRIVHTFRQAA